MFALVVAAFWVLLVWGLYDNELEPKEAAVYVVLWLALLAGFLLLPSLSIWFFVPMVLLDILLLFRTDRVGARVR